MQRQSCETPHRNSCSCMAVDRSTVGVLDAECGRRCDVKNPSDYSTSVPHRGAQHAVAFRAAAGVTGVK
jgi:hypothetical protein